MHFTKYGLLKTWLDKCLKSATSQYLLTSNMVNALEHCSNLNDGSCITFIYWLLWRQLSLKKSLLVICKILRLFVNTLTAYDKYSVLNREYLKRPIDMQLPQKQKSFSEFCAAFFKSTLNFEHIQKIDDIHS